MRGGDGNDMLCGDHGAASRPSQEILL